MKALTHSHKLLIINCDIYINIINNLTCIVKNFHFIIENENNYMLL